jgi:hypothetical protein
LKRNNKQVKLRTRYVFSTPPKIPKDPLTALVLGYVTCWFRDNKNKTIYPSDISMEFGIDYGTILKAIDYLVEKGILKSKLVDY